MLISFNWSLFLQFNVEFVQLVTFLLCNVERYSTDQFSFNLNDELYSTGQFSYSSDSFSRHMFNILDSFDWLTVLEY